MKFKDIKRKGDLTVAKRNIKAVVVMTKDKDGKLIPAENSVRFHYYLQVLHFRVLRNSFLLE